MRIVLCGLGIIGSAWARHLVADGHGLTTWNRTAKAGSTPDLATAADGAELAMIVVADGPAVRSVVERILPRLAPGAVVANHATIGVDEVAQVAALVRAAGCRFLDMPFTGSKPAAENRQNVFYVGDDDGSFARVEGIYARLSSACIPLGPVGRAMAMKLAMNLCIAGTFQVLAESLRTAERAGIDPATFFQVIDKNVAKSGLVDLKKPKLLAKDRSPQFSVKHMHKDLRLALRLAAALGQDLPMTATVEAAYRRASAKGLDEADFSALVETLA
jgi:3-hydroxyisobutyrate dehydrogenase-like beta-hydroxyacid dehydrogenase